MMSLQNYTLSPRSQSLPEKRRRRRRRWRPETEMATARQHLRPQAEEAESRDKDLGYLIQEVFKPFLLRNLRAAHLMIYLSHIQEVKKLKGTLHSMDSIGELDAAAEALLGAIARTNEPGKWQTFVDAIRAEKDSVILKTLFEEEIPRKIDGWYDHEQNVKLVDLLSSDTENSLCLEPLLPVMVQKKLIRPQDKDTLTAILSTGNSLEANGVLLVLMPRHSDRWFQIFLSILYEYDEHHRELAKLIDPEYCKDHLQGTETTPSVCRDETDTVTERQPPRSQEEKAGSRDNDLGYLIEEVFKSFLLENLRATHLMVYLSHIKEVRKLKGALHSMDNRGELDAAAEALLGAIARSDEPGKWQAFIDALREVKDSVILKTLFEGEIPRKIDGWYDHEQNGKLVHLLSSDIENSLRLEPLLPVMVQKELIRLQDKDKLTAIVSRGNSLEANGVLLVLMPRHNHRWFEIFLSILYNDDEQHRELAKLIDPGYCEERLQGTETSLHHNAVETSEGPTVRSATEKLGVEEPSPPQCEFSPPQSEFSPPQSEELPGLSNPRASVGRDRHTQEPGGDSGEAISECTCCAQLRVEVSSLGSKLDRMETDIAEMKIMLKDALATITPKPEPQGVDRQDA